MSSILVRKTALIDFLNSLHEPGNEATKCEKTTPVYFYDTDRKGQL